MKTISSALLLLVFINGLAMAASSSYITPQYSGRDAQIDQGPPLSTSPTLGESARPAPSDDRAIESRVEQRQEQITRETERQREDIDRNNERAVVND